MAYQLRVRSWPVLGLAAVLGALSQPASGFVVGHAAVSVGVISGGFRVCVAGGVDPVFRVTGTWWWTIDGVRGTSPVTRPVVDGDGPTFNPPCFVVDKAGTTTGAFVATVSYRGIGWDVVAGAVGGAVWEPGGDHPFSTSN